MSISKRHHYLPQFYLKGFLDKSKKFFVFDIKENRIKSRQYTPKEIFYEYDRNTFDINGEKSDKVEKMYQALENVIAPVFSKLRSQKGMSLLGEVDILNILLFVSSTYWRIPKTDNEIIGVIEKSTLEELRMAESVRNKNIPPEIYIQFTKQAGFVGHYRIIKALLDYDEALKSINYKDWEVYYTEANTEGELKEFHLIGDNPIIVKNDYFGNIFDEDVIMPLTSGKTLIHTKSRAIKEISPSLRIDLDTIIFLQSEKYICGPNKEYLEYVAKLSSIHKSPLLKKVLESGFALPDTLGIKNLKDNLFKKLYL